MSLQPPRDGATFRVYVMVPLLPGFEGDIGQTSYSALLAVLHWTFLSISKGPHSLLESLRACGVADPWQYVSFCSLRTHDVLCGKLVTELLYIHSKLMIVDDLYTIVGSANINDRSQAGNRDSEVCLLIRDVEFTPSHMDGEDYQAGRFAYGLRRQLMMEHLGLLDGAHHPSEPALNISVDDPVAESFFVDVWNRSARDNTRIFEENFRCYPTNMVETFEELLSWRAEVPLAQSDAESAKANLQRLVGNLVRFPVDFLKRENLSPTITSKEGLVPSIVFT